MSISVPNNTRFCVNFTFSAVSHFSFSVVYSEVQKRLIQAHSQNICSMLSFSSLQKPHWVLAVTPILFNTMLVAIILCIMRICNHLSFTSLIFCTFMKTVFQEIFDFSFSLHFKQQFGIQLSFYENVVIEPCILWCRVDCTQRDIYLICHVITNKYRRRLNILFYWTGATIKSQEINRHAKLCIKFFKSAKPPIFFYKMSDTVHSIVNPLCVFDHLVSDHHILVIENRFRKKSSLVSLY